MTDSIQVLTNYFESNILKSVKVLNFCFGGIPVARPIAALCVFMIFFLTRKLLVKIIFAQLKRYIKGISHEIGEQFVSGVEKPIGFFLIILGLHISLSILGFTFLQDNTFRNAYTSVLIFLILWAMYRIVPPAVLTLNKFTQFSSNKIFDLNIIFRNVAKFIIFSVGIITIAEKWGFNVIGFITALGIVGAAIAFAAQESVSNIFGALTLFINKSFKKGDWIYTSDVEGHIEYFGIMSTKVRTFAKALVTVPNSKLAKSAITNWSRMTSRRVRTTIGLEYRTTKDQLENIISNIKKYLAENENIQQKGVVTLVNFNEFNASSIDIFLYFFTKSIVWAEHMRVKEECFLAIKDIVEKEGASFAFPSQSLYIEKVPHDLVG